MKEMKETPERKAQEPELSDIQKLQLEVAKLTSDVRMINKWANDVNTLVIPSLDASVMLALYAMMKDKEIELPEEWDGRHFIPIQKKVDEMSKIMDAFTAKVKAKEEELRGGAKKTEL